MQKFGIVFHVKDFPGNITFINNTMTGTVQQYNDICTNWAIDGNLVDGMFNTAPTTEWTSMPAFYNGTAGEHSKYLVPEQNAAYQVHSMVLIENLRQGNWVNISNNVLDATITSNALI